MKKVNKTLFAITSMIAVTLSLFAVLTVFGVEPIGSAFVGLMSGSLAGMWGGN